VATITDKGIFHPVGAERVRVSSTDTLGDYLNSKLVDDGGATITTTVLNPGGNEQLEISAT
jgi:hypothetical protein